MKRHITTLVCLATVSITVLLTGCDRGSTPPAGRSCTIQFRRDALGAAAANPVPPMTENMNGAATSISGTLKSTAGDWVVLDQGRAEVWVPKAVILLIQYY